MSPKIRKSCPANMQLKPSKARHSSRPNTDAGWLLWSLFVPKVPIEIRCISCCRLPACAHAAQAHATGQSSSRNDVMTLNRAFVSP